jgi:hypothetical protein
MHKQNGRNLNQQAMTGTGRTATSTPAPGPVIGDRSASGSAIDAGVLRDPGKEQDSSNATQISEVNLRT